MSTRIEKETLQQIRLVLERAYPFEACGFLTGTQQGRVRHITGIIESENRSTENHRRRFVIDPIDYLNAERLADRNGLKLLGIYHSHPDHPASPSVHDLEFAQPFFSYFIHAIQNGILTQTRSYRLWDGKFIEEKFSIHESIAL